MPHQPSINRRQLQKEGLLDEDAFFSEVASEAGLADPETVRRVYLSMVRVVNRRLFTKFVCRLPHLGDFSLTMMKERSALVGKKRTSIPAKRTLKFYPLEKWTKHINFKLGYDRDFFS